MKPIQIRGKLQVKLGLQFLYTRSLWLLAKRAAKPKCPPPYPYPFSKDIYDVIVTIVTSQGLQMVAT